MQSRERLCSSCRKVTELRAYSSCGCWAGGDLDDANAEAQLLQSMLTDAQLEERLQTLSSQARDFEPTGSLPHAMHSRF